MNAATSDVFSLRGNAGSLRLPTSSIMRNLIALPFFHAAPECERLIVPHAAPLGNVAASLCVLGVDPVGFVRVRGDADGPLTKYVKNRPYTASRGSTQLLGPKRILRWPTK